MQRSKLFGLAVAAAIGAAAMGAADVVLAAPAGDGGGAVSKPHSPENGAVNGGQSSSPATTTPTPGANSFTESQARGRIEKAGYTQVSALTKTPEGYWTGTAMKDGQTATVSVDFKGVVSAQ
jgi:putative membrane protein